MKRSAIIFTLLLSFIGGIFWYGNSLPELNHNSASHHFNRPAEYVWKLIFDFQLYPKWRENVYSVEKIPYSSKYGAWKEINEDGVTTPYKLITFEQNTFITIKETGDEQDHSGTWHFDITASEDGKSSTLTITEDRVMPGISQKLISHFLDTSTIYIDAYFRSIDNKITGDIMRAKKAQPKRPIKSPSSGNADTKK